MNIYITIQTILLIATALATLYILLFAIAGLLYKDPRFAAATYCRKIAVLVPGYKEDAVIVEAAKAALQQQYPPDKFDVVIIADSFQKETLQILSSMPLVLIEVSFEKSTKSKALNSAMAQLTRNYEIAVVLDADNIMEKHFLEKVNAAFETGCSAVQGHRTAKNLNTGWAVLDAASEEINNHIFRKGHRVLGLSSAIIGSGMAFQYSYFKNLMAGVYAVGGFDKEIELKMLKQRIKIEYLDNAIVFDEKIQQPEVFSNQRRRWLSAQVHYFRNGFLDALKDLFLKGNVDYFDKAIQFIQPPRVLLLGGTCIFTMLFILLNYWVAVNSFYTTAWLLITAGCFTALLLSVPKKYYTTQTLRAVTALPKGMLLMLLSLLRIKGANKHFIHTKHTA